MKDRYDKLTERLEELTKLHTQLHRSRWEITPECPRCQDRRGVFRMANGIADKWWSCTLCNRMFNTDEQNNKTPDN